jgi:peptidoglycan/xylan/chitin deacetylase (PgdA/CDA1 family)
VAEMAAVPRTPVVWGLCLVGLVLSTALFGCARPTAPASHPTPVPASHAAESSTTSTALLDDEASRSVAPYGDPVPILMYQVIGTPTAGSKLPGLFVRPEDFQAQMQYLSANGYHPVSLQRVWDAWHGRATLPAHPVVLSFDDGYTPDYTVVAPILASHRWPAVLNLIAGRQPPQLDPSVVRSLIQDGWEIDSHTMTHVDLRGLTDAGLAFQIGESRTTLQGTFGVPVNFFCYPSGRYNARVIAAVRAAGYLAAVTTQPGLARLSQGPYTLSRVRVSRDETLAVFAAHL